MARGRAPSPVKRLSLTEYGALHFALPDEETFRCLAACKKALRRGGLAPAAANGANEEAVKQFLGGKLSFLGIGDVVTEAMERQADADCDSLAAILDADAAARGICPQQMLIYCVNPVRGEETEKLHSLSRAIYGFQRDLVPLAQVQGRASPWPLSAEGGIPYAGGTFLKSEFEISQWEISKRKNFLQEKKFFLLCSRCRFPLIFREGKSEFKQHSLCK